MNPGFNKFGLNIHLIDDLGQGASYNLFHGKYTLMQWAYKWRVHKDVYRIFDRGESLKNTVGSSRPQERGLWEVGRGEIFDTRQLALMSIGISKV